jgi:hypothetical protein
MDAMNARKCAHPVCSCMITTGRYCSVACEAMENMADIDCHCEHEGCKGHVDSADATSAAGAD